MNPRNKASSSNSKHRRSAPAVACKGRNGSGTMRHKNDRRSKDSRKSSFNYQNW